MNTKHSYAEIVRLTMATKDNRQGHPVTIREMERLTGYSYEHIRKVVKGEPIVSRELNQIICNTLGLDEEPMWGIAEREKIQRKYKNAPEYLAAPPDPFFREVWPVLTDEDRTKLKRIAEGMALANESSSANLVPITASLRKRN